MRGKLEGVARIACQNANFVPNIVFTSHRTDSILDMVTNQACVALLMDVQLPENGPRPSYSPWRAIPITPAISSQLSLCYRSDRPLSRTAQLFVDLCNDKLFTQKAWHTITVCSLQRGCFHKARS